MLIGANVRRAAALPPGDHNAMATAYIALGSNLGDRRANLTQALDALRSQRGVRLVRVSSFHETTPVDCPPGSGAFLNAAAQLETTLDPATLLTLLLEVERRLGRVRSQTNAPRTVDLDLLLYDQEVVHEKRSDLDLVVPHPRLHERLFVLVPLAEIAAAVRHPVLQRTIDELVRQVCDLEAAERGSVLRGQRALVTGSTSGIGRAIAETFARAGAHVLVHGRRSADAAQEVSQRCRALGAESEVLLADLARDDDTQRLAAAAWKTWDGLDILVANAGADTLTGEAANWAFAQKLQRLWDVDVRSTVFLTRALGEKMRDGNGGVILTMGWDQAEAGMEGDSGQLFAAVKGAVMAFTRSLAVTLAPKVRVNCLAPGWIKTAWGAQASSGWQERAVKETPLARWGAPHDVAQTALWLASPAASFITGQIVRINGGAIRH